MLCQSIGPNRHSSCALIVSLLRAQLALTSIGIVLLGAWIGVSQTDAGELLTVGSKAPKLDIEHWIQDGGGRFEHVAELKKGKVYVIEFWATWCGPCIEAMPHIAAMQRHFEERNVQFVSVSDEPLKTVEAFLDTKYRGLLAESDRASGGAGNKEAGGEGNESKLGTSDSPGEAELADERSTDAQTTYRDVTKHYCLTTDPDGSTHAAYAGAAMQNQIPVAFIVGKSGLIEWIGHPLDMPGPLNAVVSDRWSREYFAAKFKPTQVLKYARQELQELLVAGDEKAVLKRVDELTDEHPGITTSQLKLNLLLALGREENTRGYIAELRKQFDGKPEFVALWTWMVYDLAKSGQRTAKKFVGEAEKAANNALKQASPKVQADLYDTLAHIAALRGELQAAVDLQTKAVKLVGDDKRAFVEAYMKELQTALEAIEDQPPK
ncbi:MAG TPA: hypothetical protein DDW52_19105 [Planctomycetaceae bacterium]|nr:hypothetical protein [Planctomycetaceae bacterium]